MARACPWSVAPAGASRVGSAEYGSAYPCHLMAFSYRPGRCSHHRAGLTLAEVLTCLVILGVAMTAGVQALGSFAASGRAWKERNTAMELANALMVQINELPFNDPDGSNVIGRESGEITDQRTTYDDIDDYDGWDASPPVDATGAPMTAYADYRQQVTVEFDTTLAARTGWSLGSGNFKKITVTILKDDKELARLTTIRARQSGRRNAGG